MFIDKRGWAVALFVAVALIVAPASDAKKKKRRAAEPVQASVMTGASRLPVLPGSGQEPLVCLAGVRGVATPSSVMRFGEMDMDRNGELSADEITAFAQLRQQERLDYLLRALGLADADGNAQLSRGELAAGLSQVDAGGAVISSPPAATDTESYWTPERIAGARPMPMPTAPEGTKPGIAAPVGSSSVSSPGFDAPDDDTSSEVQLFDVIDSDHSGELSLQELAAFQADRHEILLEWLLRELAQADSDGNGTWSRSELEAVLQGLRKGRAEGRLSAADVNGDGRLDLGEVQAGLPALAGQFGRVDTDADGVLTREEISAFLGMDVPGPCSK